MQTLTFIIILLMTLVFIGLSTGFGFYVAGKVFHDIKGKWKGGTDGIMTAIVFVAVSYYTWVFIMAIIDFVEKHFRAFSRENF